MRHFALAVLCGFSSLVWAQPSQEHQHHQTHQHHDHQTHPHHQHHGNEEHDPVDYSAAFATASLFEGVQVEQCWVRLLPASVPSSGYFIIHNQTQEPIELLAAATPSYQHVMLHETIEADGMAKMQHIAKIDIKAQDSVSFEPGGMHVMYEQPTGTLEVGQTMELELLFAGQKKVVAQCKVNEAKARSY